MTRWKVGKDKSGPFWYAWPDTNPDDYEIFQTWGEAMTYANWAYTHADATAS